ncbi:phage tail sheath subtilisin-like domain-containing protein [Litorilinea aerophila]|uniref:Phage tail protein n=1 Tax=Litorilinea aerophila TaxID=1204385 RepID=A0A540VBW8_9CHLR|nr:phage tail sheath subtilisin-like domain-containing protein [Litorilinea aerophila]MCC9078001.1 phage tail sheath subtilisin-like domain-containing protein [Litorilinea aerophila]
MPEYLAPGVYVEEVSFRPKSIEGVSTSTTAFVGPTRRGPLTGTPEVVTSFGEFARIYGGMANLSFAEGTDANPPVINYMAHAVRSFFDNGGARLYIARTFVPRAGNNGVAQSPLVVDDGGNTVRFRARMPGSGLNGRVRVFEKLTPAEDATMNAAPVGSLLRHLGGPDVAQPASLTGGTPPFSLNNGDQLSLTLDAGNRTVTFTGTPAEVTSAALADPLTIPPNTVLNVNIGGLAQSIPLPAGDIALADLVNTLNVQLRGGYARLEGADQLVIGSDVRGTAGSVIVGDNPTLGFPGGASANGAGNVANLADVRITELNTLLEAAGGGVVASLSADNRLVLSTTATGVAATLQANDTPARAALGLPATPATGADGFVPQYFQKTATGWLGEDGVTTPPPRTDTTRRHLVTVNVEAADQDGNAILYEDLGLSPAHPRYIGEVLRATPTRLSDALQNPYAMEVAGTVTPFQLHRGLTAGGGVIALSGGNDGIEPPASVAPGAVGAVGYAEGLTLLEDIEDISIVAAPGYSAYAGYQGIQNQLLIHAENMKYRIAVLDSRQGLEPGEARRDRSLMDSKYGAFYYPWVIIPNPLARPGDERTPKEIAVPPSGFVTGIYARNDIQRGVWKAPANEVVRGALRFEREINHAQQETLNPDGVNCLRYFFGRGFLLWGARTVSSDPEWKYVNVRRYFNYLERSIDRSTQWVVFEPNGERLWANIRETVSAFLYNEWRSGALLGTRPEEAYFVRCDRSTMTQNDLDNGRLICEIGVAVLYPAEFVIFRIGQKTADARS